MADPCWAKVFENSVELRETFTDRSKLVIDLLILMTKIPGLAERSGHAVVVQDDVRPEHFEAIVSDVRVVRSAIIVWGSNFNTALIVSEARPINGAIDFSKQYELLGISLVILTLASRMLCSIVPNERALL